MSNRGVQLDERFTMALREISMKCQMARDETKARSKAWIKEQWQETDDTVDSPDSVISQVKDMTHSWLPEKSGSQDESRPLCQCLNDAELDLRQFDKALELACKFMSQKDDETPESEKTVFRETRASLQIICSDISFVRDQLGANPPDMEKAIKSVESKFCEERPSGLNDRYLWEYIMIKQTMEYLDVSGCFFERLALTKHDEL